MSLNFLEMYQPVTAVTKLFFYQGLILQYIPDIFH